MKDGVRLSGNCYQQGNDHSYSLSGKGGGRYVSSGAIAGPLVTLDMRTLYLKDLTLIGSTAWDKQVFPNLISYIEKDEIRPLLAKTFPLADIVKAQKEFMKKKHVGKFVLIPPQTDLHL